MYSLLTSHGSAAFAMRVTNGFVLNTSALVVETFVNDSCMYLFFSVSMLPSSLVFLSVVASLMVTASVPTCQAMPLHMAEAASPNAVGSVIGNCTKDSKAKAICDNCIYVTGAQEAYQSCCMNTNHLQEYCDHFLRYSPKSLVNMTSSERQPYVLLQA